jgi:tetratricopeptide (TPR) repeat protein
MELSEEKQLKHISEEFTKGINLFRKQECQQSLDIFSRIVEEYKDSQYYSVLEIQGRSKLYKALCDARLHPVKFVLEEDEDYLFDGIFHLNAKNLDTALERFRYLEEKKYKPAYANYLLSLVYLKKKEFQNCLKYLKKAIETDDFFRVIAYNEPDFETLFDNDAFLSLVEK